MQMAAASRPPAGGVPAPARVPAPRVTAPTAAARPHATPQLAGAMPRPTASTPVAAPGAPQRRTPSASPSTSVLPAGPIAGAPPLHFAAQSPGGKRLPTDGMTAVMPHGHAFAKRDPRSETGRRKGDSRQPLDFTTNQQIGRFGLIREIARGGMGQVFLARDTKLGRKVAIKFLLRDDPTFVQRFLVEARATARVTHENIVTIFEVGEHEGLPFMVLEYLEGKTLSQVLDGNPSLKQFTELMVPVARALERAHEYGIVHRDLKPSNIFVTDRGQVKVLDFGVARILDRAHETQAMEAVAAVDVSQFDNETDSSVTFTGSNSLVGTLPYMSPEQWGAGGTVDALSDIWAFGIMFWRALTGVHPAGTMSPDKLRDRLCDLETPLPSIGQRDPTIPKDLVAIVDTCLAKKKQYRYQSATDLLVDLQAFLAPRAERNADDWCPYRGLAAFGENDAKYFFGRSNEIRTALSQLETWPLLAVIGPSGVGKSSFVHAGLVPAMRAIGGNWEVRVLRPGRVPIHRLAGIIDDTVNTGEIPNDLVGQLMDSPGLFGERLRRTALKHDQRMLVVVDQLEELFTLCDSDEIRRVFLAALLAAADDATAPVRVVLSMRADFLDRLAGHKQFLAELSRGLFFLSAPDQDNLRETLVRPAELAGYTFEDPWIVEDMMQAATSRGALPLLSFAASRLWDARDRGKKQLTVNAYNQMGGVGGAFARHADQVASAIPQQSQLLLRAIMTRLVTPEGTRAVVDHNELLSLAEDKDVEQILDHLVRARLIHLHSDPDQGATVEIVHEMLITEWPTLKRWLEDSQALRGFMHELRQASKQWAARGKASDLVWRGATAEEALGYAARQLLDLNAIEKEFLAAVRVQSTRGKRRKALVFVTIICVLGLVIAGGSVAVVRITKAEHEAKQQAATVQAQLDEVKAAEAAKKIADEKAKAAEEMTKTAEEKQKEADAAQQHAQDAVTKANGQVEQSKEQLEAANIKLLRQITEANAAKKAAETAAAEARKATAEANESKARADKLLKEKEAELAKLQAEQKKIYNGSLLPGSK
jgi:serine/threonine protein kinase